jgi:serine/threonine-protein kinase
MDQSPYTTPESILEIESSIEVPKKILQKIKNAWIAGIVSITITLVLVFMSLSGTDISGIGLDYSAFVDITLMVVFTFGIYKKSRTCAILMLLLFAANKIIIWIDTGALNGLPLAFVFLWFYTQGVIGTFQYQNFLKAPPEEFTQAATDS